MKQKEEKKIKDKKLAILLLQCAIVIGCVIIFYVLITPKDRVKDTTYSYSKVEEVREYEISGNYITRVRPLTEYKTFKETAEYTLNEKSNGISYTIKIYSDSNKTQEITEGYIASGMVLEGVPNVETETGNESTNQTVTYTISVIGDFTKDGDINITELTKIIKGVVGLSNWNFTEEEKLAADFNGDGEINVVDIEECINYIVHGKLTLENGMELKSTDENGITWNYTYEDGKATNVHSESGELSETVEIPATLDGYPVASLYNSNGNIFAKTNWESNTTVKKVIISEGVTNIGNDAFYECTGLAEIIIPDSVTSIGDSTFSRCTGLQSIAIPDSVINVGSGAFNDTAWYNNQPDGVVYAGKVAYRYKGTMPSNTSIELEDGTRSITSHAFLGCTGLTEITIPDSVITIGDNAFGYCTDLTSITIPDSVTNIGFYPFEGCRNLTSIEVKENNKNYSSVDGVLFNKDKTQLIQYPIGKKETEYEIQKGVTNIGSSAFSGCTALTSIKIPSSVTSIGDSTFSRCTGLQSIAIPDSVISVGSDAFNNTAWYNNQPDGLIYIGKVAYDYKGTMPSDTVIQIEEGITAIQWNIFRQEKNLVEVQIPDSVTTIGRDAFYECTNLRSVTMSKNVIYIGEAAFGECTSLDNIVIWKNVDELESRTFDGWKDSQTINIEVNEIPEGWDENWNYGCNATIVYGYTGK